MFPEFRESLVGWCAVLLMGSVCLGAAATGPSSKPATPAIDPNSLKIKLADVASAGESVTIELGGVNGDLASDATTARIGDELTGLSGEIDARLDESLRLVGANPSLATLRSLENDWQTYSDELTRWKKALSRRADQLKAVQGRLGGEKADWQRTLDCANQQTQNFNLEDKEEHARSTIGSLADEQGKVHLALMDVYTLSNDVDEQDARVIEVLASVRQAKQEIFSHLLMRDAPPMWGELRNYRGIGEVLAAGKDSLWAQVAALGAYARRNEVRFALHGGVLVLLSLGLLWMRRRVRAALAHDPSLAGATPVFRWPILTSVVLSFLLSVWIYPEAPRLLWAMVGACALVPTVWILRGLVDQRLLVILDGMVVFFFVDQVRGVVATEAVLARGLFLVEMVGGVVFLGGFLGVGWWRRGRRESATLNIQHSTLNAQGETNATSNIQHPTSNVEGVGGEGGPAIVDARNHPRPGPLPEYRERGQEGATLKVQQRTGDRLYRVTRWFARVAMVVFGVAAVGNFLGYVSLSNLMGDGTLGSAYLAIILYAMVRLIDGILLIGLRVRPLVYLALVRRNEPLIRARVSTALHWVAFFFWGYATLQMFWVWERAYAVTWSVLSQPLVIGSLSFSLGRLAAFGLTMWAAVLVSRLVRFVLEQDVYGRISMSGGLSYTVSRVIHYLILLVGFFVAIGAAGYTLTQLTILGSAFAVGVGFGLQNIVNNFVSGLILLFERPIKVGDMVEIGGASGTVSHIGIRASVIRTPDSSEVIVPNGNLISNPVTNWTLSNRQRGIEIPVAVAAGTDPTAVMKLLVDVASANPAIVSEPAPEALFTSFDGGTFHFKLRAFTSQPERYAEVCSELGVAVNAALGREGIGIK